MERVLIVGAGPAGMATALFLAKKGIPSTLIDKATFPRDKICGDGLSGWVLHMLDKLDESWGEELVQDHSFSDHQSGGLGSWGIRFYAPNGKSITLPYLSKYNPERPPGIVMRRKEFDYFLYHKVKNTDAIEMIEGTEITDFKNDGDKIVLTKRHNTTRQNTTPTRYTGKIAVFADGARSKFAQQLSGIQKDDHHHATGIRTYYKSVTIDPESAVGNPVEFYFLRSVLPGYLWIFPLPGGFANVGIGIRTDVMKKKKIHLKSELARCIREDPQLKKRLGGATQTGPVEAWNLPLGSKKRKLSGNRCLLVGDAASLVDPFTGEGIGNALNSGMHAAEQISEAIRLNRFDEEFLKGYDKRIYDKLWKEFRISTMIQKLVASPRLFNWVMNRATRNQSLQNTFIRMIDDVDARKLLQKPWFYMKILLGISNI